MEDGDHRTDSPGADTMSVTSAPSSSQAFQGPTPHSSVKPKTLKSSRSHEHLKLVKHPKAHSIAEAHRHGSNESVASLPHVASATMNTPPIAAPAARRRDRAGSAHSSGPVLHTTTQYTQEPQDLPEISSLSLSPDIRVIPATASAVDLTDMSRNPPPRARTASPRRPAPAPPAHRRKPPAVPNGGKPRTLISPSQPSLSPLSAGFRK